LHAGPGGNQRADFLGDEHQFMDRNAPLVTGSPAGPAAPTAVGGN
jgi:hypothetical protein